MADTERYLLYMGAGFLGMMFLMSRISALRPKGAVLGSHQEEWIRVSTRR